MVQISVHTSYITYLHDMQIKNKKAILDKLGIDMLNDMQEEAQLAVHSSSEVIILSPTGTGKTLAFLLPILSEINTNITKTQAIVIAPSRELAIQIEQVAREMGTGHKVNVVYGGRAVSKDKIDLSTAPALVIGTPGRLADHLRRGTIDAEYIKTIVFDEFDKSLEIGFEDQMSEIMKALPALNKKILTSATKGVTIPKFVELSDPLTINHLGDGVQKLSLRKIISPTKDKLDTLGKTIKHLGGVPGIVFCNYKDSIQRVSDYLHDMGIDHGCFYGGMEQKDRERALIKFRNGTHNILLATDLAARGIDVPEIKFIVHYHLPHRAEEFTHRNGRTARMHKEGTAYILYYEGDDLPDFINIGREEFLAEAEPPPRSSWSTVFISGGRQDKISKGDIAGLFMKQGGLEKNELGNIELKQDCAFVAVQRSKAKSTVKILDDSRLKKRKVRIKII